MLEAVGSAAFLCMFLLLGHVVRARVWYLRAVYIPASLIGGLLGLAALQISTSNAKLEQYVSTELTAGWGELPNLLINIVFGCLFLGERVPPLSKIWRISGPQFMYGQILAWGQYAVPALITAAFLIPVLDANPLIAPVVALGFEGGHGTAAGIKATFTSLGYAQGGDLALFAATIGLISGVLFGTFLVNWAIRQQLVTSVDAKLDHRTFTGVYPKNARPIAGHQTVAVDALDSMAYHFSIVGITLLSGYVFKRCLIVAEEQSAWLTKYHFFSAFPTFPFCMLGGILVQLFTDALAKPSPIDRDTIERISGLALDFTIVSAIATMQFSGLEDSLLPFFTLVCVTWSWHLTCFFLFAPSLLPNFWVQRALAELGQSMGVTSTGLLLLRMTDPENQTPALAAFSYKQLLHEPLVGGGLWTAAVLPFISSAGIWPVAGVASSALLLWFFIYFVYFRPRYLRDERFLRGNVDPSGDYEQDRNETVALIPQDNDSARGFGTWESSYVWSYNNDSQESTA
eukprot:m.116065 g.116065  ORF g.116065 m.116065 type:complete len:514 (-) comp15387_c0_seq2:1114-2655(-)